MERSLAELEELVRSRICHVCSDRRVDGSCGLQEPAECALFRLFPQVAEAIQMTDSNDVQDYIQAIRAKVCSICTDQDSKGDCEKRSDVQCALDAYLLLIVEAIEEATGKSFDRPVLAPSGVVSVRF